ncbi:MAG: outer membrane lipoprotein-sorting protein [Bacteroidota bacterium]
MKIIGFVLLTIALAKHGRGQDAKEIIREADEKMRGESSHADMKMQIIRPAWERTIEFESWSKGIDYSMTLVTAPTREAGQTFLKRENELWQYNPTISRLIKLPPSMMSQGWMGSDYSNDDILKESSIVVDYNHEILGSESIDGYECWKIELQPKESAVVVWGKLIKWISKADYLQLKSEYYDEDKFLVKTETASNLKMMDDRKIPTHFEILPAEEPDNKTIVEIISIEFNTNISLEFFTQQNMKKISRR